MFFQSVTQGAQKKKCLFLGTVLKDTPQKEDDIHQAIFLVHFVALVLFSFSHQLCCLFMAVLIEFCTHARQVSYWVVVLYGINNLLTM